MNCPRRPVRVCYFGTYDLGKPRNRILMAALRAQGAEVIQCHFPVWRGVLDKTQISPVRDAPIIALRLVLAYLLLPLLYMAAGTHDVVIVAYLGQLDVPLAWLLTRITGRRLAFDPFLSLYDTVVLDRCLVQRSSLLARLLLLIDRFSCSLADIVITDTLAQGRFFKRELGLRRKRFARAFVGAEEGLFAPGPESAAQRNERKVLFYGQFIPLHGIDAILRAAALLRDKAHFTIIGKGQTYPQMRKLAEELGCSNVSWIDWVPYESLVEHLRAAAIVLGIFGTTPKAARVIPNKVFQALSAGRPVITASTPAARELLRSGESALLCERGSPQALASAIAGLLADAALRKKLARNGHRVFLERASQGILGKELFGVLESIQRGRP